MTALVLNDPDLVINPQTENDRTVVVTLTGATVTDDNALLLFEFLKETVSAGIRLLIHYGTATVDDTFTIGNATVLQASTVSAGATELEFLDASWMPDSGYVYFDDILGTAETVQYSSRSGNTITLVGSTANDHTFFETVEVVQDTDKGFSDTAAPSQGGQFSAIEGV